MCKMERLATLRIASDVKLMTIKFLVDYDYNVANVQDPEHTDQFDKK